MNVNGYAKQVYFKSTNAGHRRQAGAHDKGGRKPRMALTRPQAPTVRSVTHLACVLQYNTRYYLCGDQISGIFYGNKHLVSERVDGGHLIYTPDTPARLSTPVFTPLFTPQPQVIRM